MRRRTGWYLFAMVCLAAVWFLSAPVMKAGSTTVTVTPNPANATVAVSVSSAELIGKDISVVCYEPGVTGAVSDMTANKNRIVYMNQYTVNGTVSFSFQVKKQSVAGEYTLVVSSEQGQEVKKFRLKEDEPAAQVTAAPQGTSVPGVSNTVKKKLKAPVGVKAKSTAKKKVTVTWNKVKNAKGYLVSISMKKNGKYKVKLTVKGGSKKKAVLRGLKRKKTYYIKVRAYDTSGKKKVAGKYSKAVKVKVR